VSEMSDTEKLESIDNAIYEFQDRYDTKETTYAHVDDLFEQIHDLIRACDD